MHNKSDTELSTSLSKVITELKARALLKASYQKQLAQIVYSIDRLIAYKALSLNHSDKAAAMISRNLKMEITS